MATILLPLDRVPAERAAWKPHPKSMSLGELASHLADSPVWVRPTIRAEPFAAAVPDGDPCRTPPFASREEAVRRLDRNLAAARNAISGTDDAALTGPLHPFITGPGAAHRHLRMKDVPLPGIYGPTAHARPKGVPTWLGQGEA